MYAFFNSKKFILRTAKLSFIILLCFSVLAFLWTGIQKKYIFPLKYIDSIKEYSDEFNVDKFLILSVIKVESNFNKSALSEKNAKGLMQVIDSTANYVAKQLHVESFDIFDEDTNIRFGIYYLSYLINKFEIVKTALCAYNAGEGNVKKWLNDSRYSFDGKNLTYIPFSETRNYIKKIEKSFSKYKKLYENLLDKS